jgi:Tfp pilus assembly protein PilF
MWWWIYIHTQAVSLRPDSVETRYNLGLVYLKADQDAKAKEQFEGVLEEEPGNEDVLKALKLIDRNNAAVKKAIKKVSVSRLLHCHAALC